MGPISIDDLAFIRRDGAAEVDPIITFVDRPTLAALSSRSGAGSSPLALANGLARRPGQARTDHPPRLSHSPLDGVALRHVLGAHRGVGHRLLLFWTCGHATRASIAPAGLEHVTFCFAVGTLSFFMLMFAGGLAMAYGPVFFVALPLVMTAIGGFGAFRYLRRLRRHLTFRASRNPHRTRIASIALTCLGLVAVFLFYLPGIVPSHVAYDSSWYHLPIAEHYATLGGIRPFQEGWYMGAIPHLASVIYCWAFLIPRSVLFDYVELSTHLEFAVMLMMLPGIPALVRRLVPSARAHASWIAFFTFPGVYWYDLFGGGDQFAALWSVPIALALLRVCQS